MVDPKGLRKDELVSRGRVALKSGRHRVAHELFAEYCERQLAEEAPIPGPVLADYAVSVAYLGDLKEAAEICFRALALDRRNADAYSALARVYVLSGHRRKAIESLDRGFAIAPRHPGLRALRDEIGVRRNPMIPFLSRDNRFNILLGKVLGRLRPRGKVA